MSVFPYETLRYLYDDLIYGFERVRFQVIFSFKSIFSQGHTSKTVYAILTLLHHCCSSRYCCSTAAVWRQLAASAAVIDLLIARAAAGKGHLAGEHLEDDVTSYPPRRDLRRDVLDRLLRKATEEVSSEPRKRNNSQLQRR